jgi:hypothetical protein
MIRFAARHVERGPTGFMNAVLGTAHKRLAGNATALRVFRMALINKVLVIGGGSPA